MVVRSHAICISVYGRIVSDLKMLSLVSFAQAAYLMSVHLYLSIYHIIDISIMRAPVAYLSIYGIILLIYLSSELRWPLTK